MADRPADSEGSADDLIRDLVQHWDAGDIDNDYDAITSAFDSAREYVRAHGGLAGEHRHPALAASPVAESRLRKALRSMIEHDEEQRDNCGDWGTNTCLIRERARTALAAAAPPAGGLDVERLRAVVIEVIEAEAQDALDTGIRPSREPELGAWNYVAEHFKQWAPFAADRIAARLASRDQGADR